MALSGWTKKCRIDVAANKIASSGTNQVLLFSAGHFNTDMLTSGGPNACKADGSDLRFALDANGDTLLGAQVLNISLSTVAANSKLVVAVRFPTIVANADFSFYCHWGNSTADFPAPLTTAGSGTCWSEFYGVLPLTENPASFTTTASKWKCFKDATSRYSAGSLIGTVTSATTSPIPGLPAIQVGTAGGIQVPEVASTQKGGFQIAMLCYIDTSATGCFFTELNTSVSNGFSFNSTGVPVIQYSGDYGTNFTSEYGKWGMFRLTNTGGNWVYKLGTKTSNAIAWATGFTNLQYISSGTAGISMKVCLFMINQFVNVPDSYFTNLLNSVTYNSTLASASTTSAASVASSLTFTGLATSSEVRIYSAGTTTELYGIENTDATGTVTYSYSSGGNVDIQIFNILYEPIRYTNFTLGSSSTTIPIQQQFDRNYYNP